MSTNRPEWTDPAPDQPEFYRPQRRPVRPPAALPPSEFAAVLSKLASDPAYRERATQNPDLLADDFRLTLKDLKALRQVAILSGADVTRVNSIRAREIAANVSGLSAADVDVSCCSCCCCCCGETAVASSMGVY